MELFNGSLPYPFYILFILQSQSDRAIIVLLIDTVNAKILHIDTIITLLNEKGRDTDRIVIFDLRDLELYAIDDLIEKHSIHFQV